MLTRHIAVLICSPLVHAALSEVQHSCENHPPVMAVGGDVGTEKRFMLPISDITLTISQGDIIETGARSIATGEDRSVAGHGNVSQLLLKVCPKAYKKARDEMKRHNSGRFEPTTVYPCSFPNPPSGGKKGVSFSIVLHAIVPSAKEVTCEKEWMDKMKTLYYNLFKEADSQGKASLALPLLGSGMCKLCGHLCVQCECVSWVHACIHSVCVCVCVCYNSHHSGTSVKALAWHLVEYWMKLPLQCHPLNLL